MSPEYIGAYAFIILLALLAVMVYLYSRNRTQPDVVDDNDSVSWFMLSPDNTSVECTECPTSWPVHPNEELQLFATLRRHGREHAMDHAR